MEHTLYTGLLIAWFVLAGGSFATLLFVPAPYGRHARGGWGPSLDPRLGWLLMEAPGVLAFGACFAVGRVTLTGLVFLLLWQAHYLYRAFVYPLLLPSRGQRLPLAIAGMGAAFNVGNGYLNGRYLTAFSAGYPLSWLLGLRFLLGLTLFVAGFALHVGADRTLRRLRAASGGYGIPEGGPYRLVSCPNYLGEIVEWSGWALATWSLPGLAFAVWTAANLAPRARAHHLWYRARFAHYPPKRRALVPWVW